MGALSVVWSILSTLLLIYFFIMWARFVLDLIRTFNRGWRPADSGSSWSKPSTRSPIRP
ncbi:hypothetical protein [Agromyces protaetiae]|uniref:hypothetical protein n=1 Tax=Agromyces protaetiae TaxID=2509455 RepID=UPI0026C1696F